MTLVSQVEGGKPTRDMTELKKKAYKKVIELCENKENRDIAHYSVKCDVCSKCKVCRDIRASSYNNYQEQIIMEKMVKYVRHDNGKTGHFESPLPLKPFNPGTIHGN